MKRPVLGFFLLHFTALTLALVLTPFTLAQSAGKLTIEDIFADGGVTGRGPENIQWRPDNAGFSFVQRDDSGTHGELWYVDAATGAKQSLVTEAKLATLSPSLQKITDEREKERLTRYNVAAYLWAPDSKQLLFDSRGQLWLYSLATGTGVQFTAAPDPSQDPKFSPDGNLLAFVRKHNLFVQPVSGKDAKQLTKDKDENLLNGEVDWVYAEELEVRSNYFWSPESKQIVYLQIDETRVPTYPITDWMPTHPEVEQEKYPKAGDPNPAVKLGVVSASGGKTRWISLSNDPDIYIPRFGWVREGIAYAMVLNRRQDTLDLYFIDTDSGRSRKVLTESDPTGWVAVNDDFRILKSGDKFLWSSWRTGNTHLYLYSFDPQNPLSADAKLERPLTQGDFQVLAVAAVDESAGVVYFTSNKDDAREQQIYSVKLDGSDLKRVSQEKGTHGADFSEDGKYYLDSFSTQTSSPRMSVCAPGGSCQKVWESRSVDGYGLRAPKFLEFKAEDGTVLYGSLLLPPDAAAGAKIPVIVNTYGGMAGQLVRNAWIGTTGLFHQILAGRGFAVFTVDNRGTPNRDRKFQIAIRHEFGRVELRDQLAALDQLTAQYPQLDRSRTAIWGWSNGGSMTLYAMTHSDAFKAGVAVAPVTDSRNYDSIYMERFLGLPKEDPQGYDDSAVPPVADKLHGSLLLVHGTSDDNVHFQNSVQMVDALIKAGKQFRFMMYPNKTHGIAGAAARTHLFHMMEDHFERELK
ncbi:MAG: S9 family peptidase [Acidobacteria bacterium]|nr:S9 family peptidase [Acidobacteriota bacterium]